MVHPSHKSSESAFAIAAVLFGGHIGKLTEITLSQLENTGW